MGSLRLKVHVCQIIASLEIKALAEGNLGLIKFCRVDILYFSYFGEDT